MTYKKTTLPNGLRIITVPMKSNPAVTVLVAVETGSNYENKSESGLSHFLEHMCFKATDKRPSALAISRELDGLGAQSNAFTTNEFTGYYAKAEKRHFTKLLDILSDIYQNPTFPEAELEKERGVILQEISMYEDLPQRHVWDVLSKLLYGDTPAGRSIVGPKENIRSFKRKDFIKYRNAHYVAGKTIIVVAGDVDEKEVKREVSKAFKSISTGKVINKPRVKETQKSPAMLVEQKKTDQMHMVLAFKGFDAHDKRIPALSILSGVLGGGMSSRLFQRLREEMGVCYYVRSANDEYTDHGYFAISTGIDPKRVDEVIKAVLLECERLTTEIVPEEELQKTKDYLSGNLYLGLETTDSLAEFYAIQEIVKGKIDNPARWEKELRAVTAIEVQKVARDIFRNERMNLAIVGQVKNEKAIKKILSF